MSPHGDYLFVTSSKQGSLAAYAIDNKGGLKKEASVKIGERFWDILMGGLLGALAGQALGHDTTSTLSGTGVGAAVGYGVGNEVDKNRNRTNFYKP